MHVDQHIDSWGRLGVSWRCVYADIIATKFDYAWLKLDVKLMEPVMS